MSSERIVQGRSIVAGFAIGRLVALAGRTHDSFRLAITENKVGTEIVRLRMAVDKASTELERTRTHLTDSAGEELGAIFDAQHLLLRDPELQGRIETHIREHLVNSEWAVTETIGHHLEQFAALQSSHFRDRAGDLRDVGLALLRALTGDAPEAVMRLESAEPVVVLARDLTPSETIRLSRVGVIGLGLEVGGQTSHTAIIARSLGIPLVAGLARAAAAVPEASHAIVDGERGLVVLDPEPETLKRYGRQAAESDRRAATLVAAANVEAVTQDGVHIQLLANIDLPDELPDIAKYGAEGIGLYRSEFLFIERSPDLPTEDEQVQVLRDMLEAAAPGPTVVRTFDLGGRKLAREVIETHEDNPVLGLRGIRLTLHRRDIFKSQVRAILRAGAHGQLRVLLPMVTGVEEIDEFRQLVGECAAELEGEGQEFSTEFRLGAMVEVPSAALIADHLARRVDFLALGTNDLVQYALAVDRGNEHVAYLYEPLHPAILRMVRFVVDSARKGDVGVMICGEVAADPRATALMLGLGLRRL
ncbi:MAG: phosphoenolpyruvate--protein phosphotransferase [Acidobacteria bacterium]|nr:phosphoenolpyruvate--protein phosphotransferase [Acidobacteriota bacterium]